MTVIVTLKDGAMVKYMRFSDAYHENGDGTLDVLRTGVKRPDSYAPGEWTDVEGDQKKWKKSRFWG